MPRNLKHVAALAYEGLCTFEFGIVVELFGLRGGQYAGDRTHDSSKISS